MGHNLSVDHFFNKEYVHKPVLWREIIDIVDSYLKRDNLHIVDCTLGEGGHSEVFLKYYKDCRVTAFERDGEILDIAKKRLSPFDGKVRFINDNFSNIEKYLSISEGIDVLLYDFGISSYHFDSSGRGFAFAKDEPLDMRLGGCEISAFDVVNSYEERELARIFKDYGQENWAVKIAKVIVERRVINPIKTTGELASIVLAAIPKKFHVKNIHPATRIFQALRIEVNKELIAIEKGLSGGIKVLQKGGLMLCISFHSLEDRLVKNFFRDLNNSPSIDFDIYGKKDPVVEIITRKPLMACDDELLWNNRARSAKLRAACKIREI